MCVTVICWYSTVGYRVTVVCELQYCVGTVQLGTGIQQCVCVTVLCWCSTVGYRVAVVCVCVTEMCW